jgi:hypothetical protein
MDRERAQEICAELLDQQCRTPKSSIRLSDQQERNSSLVVGDRCASRWASRIGGVSLMNNQSENGIGQRMTMEYIVRRPCSTSAALYHTFPATVSIPPVDIEPVAKKIRGLCAKAARADSSETEAIFAALQLALMEHTQFVREDGYDSRRRPAHPRTAKTDRRRKER